MNVRRGRKGFWMPGTLELRALLLLLVAACGGAASPPASKSPAMDPSNSQDSPYGSPGVGQSLDAPQGYPRAPSPGQPTPAPVQEAPSSGWATAPSTPAATAPDDNVRAREAALGSARADVEAAQRDLEGSLGECKSACRALGSMERATGHLCDLATGTDDRRQCEDAKTRVQRARDRIRATCGTCPDGPSLERRAPIPSRP